MSAFASGHGQSGINLRAAANASGSGASLVFSDTVAAAASTFLMESGVIQRFDPTALAVDAMTLEFPASPTANDQVSIKNVGTSPITIVLDGNGSDVEFATALGSVAASYSYGGSGATVFWQYDGSSWRVISL